jgi:hypothetical protein
VDVDRISAFRLSRHHLVRRLPAGALTPAVAAAGIQETPLRTAALALHARVTGVSTDEVDRALRVDKTLLTIWGPRGAPYLVPAGEVAVFTTGALPAGEDSWRTFFGGWAASLGERKVPLEGLVREAAEAAREVLDGRQLPVEDFRQELARRMPEIRGLSRPSGAHADLPEPLFRATGLLGVVCIADVRRMTDALLARTDQWLGAPPATDDEAAARPELLRRYLRCYGPAGPQAFAEWTARHVADVRDVFASIEAELVPVGTTRPAEWLLADDAAAPASPDEPVGARLLPAQDPFLQQRDRDRLLPDREQRRRLWRPAGAPGLVLVDGRPAGVWTSRRRGEELQVTVEPFVRLTKRATQSVAAEAASIAALRGAESATVTVAD